MPVATQIREMQMRQPERAGQFPLVVIVTNDEAPLPLIRAVEREVCVPLLASSDIAVYGHLAEFTDRIALVLLDEAQDENAATICELLLDAPRVAAIPVIRLSDHGLTHEEDAQARPGDRPHGAVPQCQVQHVIRQCADRWRHRSATAAGFDDPPTGVRGPAPDSANVGL